MKGIEFPTQIIRIQLASRKYETLRQFKALTIYLLNNTTYPYPAHEYKLLVFNVHINAARGCVCFKGMEFQKSKI